VETIRVVLDARRQKMNRAALVRQALQEHLKQLTDVELDEKDRRGYAVRPQLEEEIRPWEEAAAWPEPYGR
jgi:metal-responsive CopG/Arc/MetJ family transcriptional regulator